MTMDGTAIARRLKERGRDLGLGAVGIASLEPSRYGDVLRRWLRAGHAGRMSWMERTAGVRADPRSRFSWARSAIVAAVSYLPYRGARENQGGLVRRVARYALGRDYHAILGERLTALLADLRSEAPQARARIYVDTGPLLERELATRAGLGWFGKNTNLIGPRGDSWLLLGLILTDLELPPDGPVTDHCGTCTACIDDCPTGAILEPYVVDSTRCISYLTIELREAVPTPQRREVGDWVFGCDVCQEVCPWNRKIPVTTDEDFRPGEHLSNRSLADLIRMGETTFHQEYGATPLERPRRPGLVRNALIVAANTDDEAGLEAATETLADPDPMLRGTAAWAIGEAGGSGARRRALERALEREPDHAARTEMEHALSGAGSERRSSRMPGVS
jgi:epoxyqueuosine reductase